MASYLAEQFAEAPAVSGAAITIGGPVSPSMGGPPPAGASPLGAADSSNMTAVAAQRYRCGGSLAPVAAAGGSLGGGPQRHVA